MMKSFKEGFTIVELLIVIVIIAILASISVVAYNGVQSRAANSKRESDLTTYQKAIVLARESTGKTLIGVTGTPYSEGYCNSYFNPGIVGVEPKDVPKTDMCWVQYYDNLSKIGAAAGMNLDSLRSGDARGNPYMLNENEGEAGNCAQTDTIRYYVPGSGFANWKSVPLSGFCT